VHGLGQRAVERERGRRRGRRSGRRRGRRRGRGRGKRMGRSPPSLCEDGEESSFERIFDDVAHGHVVKREQRG
jgi:hypothetical protein